MVVVLLQLTVVLLHLLDEVVLQLGLVTPQEDSQGFLGSPGLFSETGEGTFHSELLRVLP